MLSPILAKPTVAERADIDQTCEELRLALLALIAEAEVAMVDRRAILSGLAALPLAGGPPAVVTNPDVAALAIQYAAALSRARTTMDARDAAAERVVDPEPPPALYGRDEEPIPFGTCFFRMLEDGRRWYGDDDASERLRSLTGHIAWLHPGAAERRAELLDAYDEWERSISAAEDAVGLRAAEAAFRAADDGLVAIRNAIVRLRSPEPAVLRLKLQVLADLMEGAEYLERQIEAGLRGRFFDEAVALSIARDLCPFIQVAA